MEFADKIFELQRLKKSVAILGVDPQLDSTDGPGVPKGYTLARFCCEIVEACAEAIVAIKPQLAFFEARGVEGMRAFVEVIKLGRRLGLATIADAKRGDVGNTSAAYAEAFLSDGDFGCDAVTVNPYQGSDAIAPFVAEVRKGRGVFVLVRNSNPSAAEFQELEVPFQDLEVPGGRVWEKVAARVAGWGSDFIGRCGLSSVGAVVGANYPEQAKRARELMPNAVILVPAYGAQGGRADGAVASARDDQPGILVSASRSLIDAWRATSGLSPGEAALAAALKMRDDLNAALSRRASAGA